MKKYLVLFFVLAGIFLFTADSFAGAKLKIGDSEDMYLDLGMRVQTLMIANWSKDKNGDGDADDSVDFYLRRARFRLKGVIGKYASMFMQTDVSGKNMEMIDAFIDIHPFPFLKITMGEHMNPSLRTNITSSACLLAGDRPSLTYKTLTWGLKAKTIFTSSSVPGTSQNDNYSVPFGVRDLGLTVNGNIDLTKELHLKYYVGIYKGMQLDETVEDINLRYTGRIEVNLFDAESGYFHKATYLGKKKTVAVGFSYDYQNDIGTDNNGSNPTDYNFYTLDIFAELPIAGLGALTVEGAFMSLDLDGAVNVNDDTDINGKNNEGIGGYGQVGFYISSLKLQVWQMFEMWNAEAAGDVGDFWASRTGVTYYHKGFNLNAKLGFEYMKSPVPIAGNDKQNYGILFGFYANY
ncbi:hypothetical protein ACFL20_10010 [Spirochaetota bacterium]